VLAHEYAHIIIGMFDWFATPEEQHGKPWEQAYNEVCLVLGVFAIPPRKMYEIVSARPGCAREA